MQYWALQGEREGGWDSKVIKNLVSCIKVISHVQHLHVEYTCNLRFDCGLGLSIPQRPRPLRVEFRHMNSPDPTRLHDPIMLNESSVTNVIYTSLLLLFFFRNLHSKKKLSGPSLFFSPLLTSLILSLNLCWGIETGVFLSCFQKQNAPSYVHHNRPFSASWI